MIDRKASEVEKARFAVRQAKSMLILKYIEPPDKCRDENIALESAIDVLIAAVRAEQLCPECSGGMKFCKKHNDEVCEKPDPAKAEQQGGNAVVGKVIESPPFDYSEGFEEQAQHDKSIELIKAKARLEAFNDLYIRAAANGTVITLALILEYNEAHAEVEKLEANDE